MLQELCKHKRRITKSGKAGLFSGILRCADCGGKLYFASCKSSPDHYVCSNYKSNMGSCSAHYIRESSLNEMVLGHIQGVLRYIQQFESTFVRNKYNRSFNDRRLELAEMSRVLAKNKRRISELDTLFKRIYEDFVLERLTEERYKALSKLTPTILNEFVSRIEVHAPEKINGKRHQSIDIFYNAVGVIDIPSDEEFEAIEEAFKAKRRAREQMLERSPQTGRLPLSECSQAERLPQSS